MWLRRPNQKKRRIAADKRGYVCSFQWCCEAVGINAGRLRQRVLKLWRENPAALQAMIDQLEINFGAQTNGDVVVGGRRQAGKHAALAGRREPSLRPLSLLESIPEQHGEVQAARDRPHLPAAIRRQ